MRSACPFALALALFALTSCREQPAEPQPRNSTLPNADPGIVAAQPTSPSPSPSASPSPPSPPPLSSKDPLALPPRLTALGTEPFWAAKVDGNRLTYSTPSDQQGRAIVITRTTGAGFASVEGLLDGRILRLVVTAGPCSDGMSDTVYPLTVERTVGDSVNTGCARPE